MQYAMEWMGNAVASDSPLAECRERDG